MFLNLKVKIIVALRFLFLIIIIGLLLIVELLLTGYIISTLLELNDQEFIQFVVFSVGAMIVIFISVINKFDDG